jgi:hypothetical protein
MMALRQLLANQPQRDQLKIMNPTGSHGCMRSITKTSCSRSSTKNRIRGFAAVDARLIQRLSAFVAGTSDLLV